MKSTLFKNLLLTLLCATQISVNTCGMENKQLKLLPEIQGKIVTTLLDLYLNELEKTLLKQYKHSCGNPFFIMQVNTLDNGEFQYKKYDINLFLYKMLYWIHLTHFKSLQEHIDLNTTSNNGNTILHHTTRASLECTDSDNLHPSSDHYMQYNGNKDMFDFTRYLLEHNANPNTHNDLGESPFFIWTKYFFYGSYGKQERPIATRLIHLFLEHKADPNIASKDNSFIFTLVSGNYSQVARILKNTDLKAIMNSTDENGETLASWAATWFNLEFLQILAEAGADFNITNSNGQTPLDIAVEYKLRIVKEYGAEHAEKIINLLKGKTQKNDQ